MIVATAGHIDHGKTRLVGAITGIDTDRLPEEKARGISIDVGFAYWNAPSGRLLGFVDVPGHERFVRNMLAGVCGIDFALVIVAADDGVMPQTTEHVQILDLLGIDRGIVVMTKVDRVDLARRDVVRAEIRSLLEGTTLQGANIIAASAVTGEGIAEVKGALACAADEDTGTDGSSAGHFRLAVDRSFSVGGSGTVVTGTVFDGVLEVGSRVRISPKGIEARVRGIREHVSEAARVAAGQRCALNLAGISVEEVSRGDWIVAESLHRPTQRFDAAITLLAPHRCAFSASSRVHLHIGAADVLARIRQLQGDPGKPEGRMLMELTLERPILAVHGDRFILRDSAGSRTLGGGCVLDPFVMDGRRRSAERLARLAALSAGGARVALPLLLSSVPSLDRDRFEATFNLQPQAARTLYADLGVEALDDILMSRAAYASCCDGIHAHLGEFHARQPGSKGMRVQDLRVSAAPGLPTTHFDAILKLISGANRIVVKGDLVRSAKHGHAASDVDGDLWARVEPMLAAAAGQPPRVTELAEAAGSDVRKVSDMLYRRRAAGVVFRVGEDRFCLRASLAAFAATAASVARSTSEGAFTAAQFRDAIGSGRILAIQVLEALDVLGVTLRVGDKRRMYRDPVALLGSADPLPAPVAPPLAITRPAPPLARSARATGDRRGTTGKGTHVHR